MGSSSSVSLHTLPLFPLPDVVLFPGTLLPLHIFEPRYRLMVKTQMAANKQFGVLRLDPRAGTQAEIGCSTLIAELEKLPDGRMNILTHGQRRFRVRGYLQQTPYIIGQVEWFDDGPDDPEGVERAGQVRQLLEDVAHLSSKLAGKEIALPDDIPEKPENLSYWIASSLYSVAAEQQCLLEMEVTSERLKREAEILTAARNELAARSALKSALG